MNRFMILFLILLISSTRAYSEEIIRIATGEFPPYSSEKLRYYGLVSRIVTEAFALQGIKVEYGFFPWRRAFMYTRIGNWDASSFWYYHVDREKDFYHSDLIIQIKEVFFHLKSYKFDWNKWSDLKELNIGTTIGYTVTKILEENKKIGKFNLEKVPSDQMNLRKLLIGRIKLFPVSPEVAYSLLNRDFTPSEAMQLTYHPKPIHVGKSCLLFVKTIQRNKRMLTLFNKGLEQLRSSGKYDQYFKDVQAGVYDDITK